MRITLKEYQSNPQLRLALELEARRERTKALGQLFANVYSHMKAGHAPRTHLAVKG